MPDALLKFLDIFFYAFHSGLIFFNVFGWLVPKWRFANFITLSLTAFSWFVLGIWHGWGYCFCTDWHWEVRESLGYQAMSGSYIHFLILKLTGMDFQRNLVDWTTGIVFFSAFAISTYLNFQKWIRSQIRSIIALSIVVLIPFSLMIWIRNHQSTGFAGIELILYPLLFGGLSIGAIFTLKKYFLKEELKDFNSGKGKWSTDITWGLLLTLLYFILFYLERLTLSQILRFNSNQELLGLMLDMRENPFLVFLWFGPVLWIGIALYEELIRVFLLTSLWEWSDNRIWTLLTILISATIFGIAHWNQGSYGVVTIGIKSLVSGFFFLKKKRLMPLVYAHVLYDGIQVALLLLTYPDS